MRLLSRQGVYILCAKHSVRVIIPPLTDLLSVMALSYIIHMILFFVSTILLNFYDHEI